MSSSVARLPLPVQLTAGLLLALAACDTRPEVDRNAGSGAGPRLDGGLDSDARYHGVPDGYVPWPCDKPGLSCTAHDPCAVNPICGPDMKCWPSLLLNCDDGLECTDDRCKGEGVCANEVREGYCAVPVRSGTTSGGAPITTLQCVPRGFRNPYDPCLGCNPSGPGTGAKNSTSWAPVSGGACNDNRSCTKNDACINGTCQGTYYGDECSDGLHCTEDLCDGKGGCLGSRVISGWCLINGVCYRDEAKHPSGACLECDSGMSVYGWSPMNKTCNIDGRCYRRGESNPGKCAECDPAVSRTRWTVKGNVCLILNVCKKPGDRDATNCGRCDPATDRYGWSPIAGQCNISGTCFARGVKHSDGCAECDPAANSRGWTVKGNACLVADNCYKPRDQDPIKCAECDPARDRYAWTPLPGKCKIGGSCHARGETHPGKCAVCDPSVSATSWTVKGNECLIDGSCVKSGAKEPSGCSACDPSSSKVAWTRIPGQCRIDGRCYPDSASHPGGCASCDLSRSSSEWTVSRGTCLIDGTCYSSGARHPRGCATCSPATSQTSWSSTTHCAIQGNCFKSGARESGGCGICTPGKDPGGWTRSSNCLETHAWSRRIGGSTNDYPHAVAVDKDGNVYVTGTFTGQANFGGSTISNRGYYDIFVASYTASGTHRWSRGFGGSSYDFGFAVDTDGMGNVYLAGFFNDSINLGGSSLSSQGGSDIFIASFDRNGQHRWSKSFGTQFYDYAYDLAADADGVCMTGSWGPLGISFGGSTLVSQGGADVYLVCFNGSGSHRWSRSFGNSTWDIGHGVTLDNNGNVFATGMFYNSARGAGVSLTSYGSADIYVVSFSPYGVLRWADHFGGSGADDGHDIATDPSGNLLVTGSFSNGAQFGGTLLSSKGSAGAYLLSLSPGGMVRWVKGFGGTRIDSGSGVATDSKGNVYLTGTYFGNIDLGGSTLISNGATEIFAASFSPSGAHRWSRTHGSTGDDNGRKIAVDHNANVYAAGEFRGTVDFGGGALVSSGTDVFLMKIRQ